MTFLGWRCCPYWRRHLAGLHAVGNSALFLVAAVPLSLNLEEMEIGGLGVYLPTEPLPAGLLLCHSSCGRCGFPVDQRLLRHPLTYWVSGSLVWILLTAIVSEYPVISLNSSPPGCGLSLDFSSSSATFSYTLQSAGTSSFWPTPFPCIIIIYTLIRHAGFA